MKLLSLATIAALTVSAAAFAQSTATPPNPNNCSPAFPNCSSVINGNNKTPGNTEGSFRNEQRQQGQLPQTSPDPNLPMNNYACKQGQANCPSGPAPVPGATGPATAPPSSMGR